jgi:LPS-assembly protein
VIEDEFRGHLFSYGQFALNENWRTDYQVELSTDDTYLRVYQFNDHNPLETRGTVEYFEGRQYGVLNSFFFDGQRQNDNDEEAPIILPEIGYFYVTEPLEGNDLLEDSVFRVNSGFLGITRIEGQDVRRLAFEGEWEKPYVHDSGGVFTFKGSLIATAYAYSDSDPNSDALVPPPGVTPTSGTTGRIFPAAAVEWRYPLVSNQGWINQTVEPIVQLVAAPDSDFLAGDDIPNEDSRDVEFDDANLFSLNRFPGIDRVSGGSRVDYGFRWTGQSDQWGYGEFLIGQSYRFAGGNSFSQPTGLAEDFSDIVGRLSVFPDPTFGASYRFRLDKDNFDGRRQDLDIVIGPPAYRISMGYLLSAEETTPGNSIVSEEELQLGFNSRLNKFWYFSARWIKDLNTNDTRSFGFGLLYRDECCDLRITAEREFYQDREIEPGNTVFVEVLFKHLGGVQGGN